MIDTSAGRNLTAIDIIIPQVRPRRWQVLVAERLRRAGHDVAIIGSVAHELWPRTVEVVLGLERRALRSRRDFLAAIADDGILERPIRSAALRLDLTGTATESATPTLSLAFDGDPSPATAIASLAAGRLPELTILLDGKTIVGEASPMVDNRFLVAAGLEDVLARVVTLTVSAVARFESGTLPKGAHRNKPASVPARPAFLRPYLLSALPRLAHEMARWARFRFAHWRVGYRFVDGPGVAESGRLGSGWSVLPDDGERFFADPFPFERQGRHYIFVEDYSHAAGKASISVAEIDAVGRASAPRQVIEEAHHLSYPQVFERDGTVWMLPEGSGGRELVLYRAEQFPDRWVRDTVLFTDRELSDATLVEHGGRLWLFATDRDGRGSTSDTLAVFHAADLRGPWVAHPANPIVIDRAAARPGGAFVRTGGRLVLPVQDGTLRYGGGLGLLEVVELTETSVRMTRPAPITADGDWPYPQIHTLNRAGRLEVIDGIAEVPRRARQSLSSAS